MSFEDDMIEDGFHDEQDYLDYLCEEADRRLERMNESDEDYHQRPSYLNDGETTRKGLHIKLPDGSFMSTSPTSKRLWGFPLKAGHFVCGPHFNYIDMDNAIIIPDQYDEVEYFKEGITRCRKGRRWVLINESCEELPLSEKESVERTFELDGKRFYCVRGLFSGASGLIDEKGNVLLPTIFRFIHNKSDCIEVGYDTETFSAPYSKNFTLEELLSIVKRPSGFLDWEKESWPEEIIPFVDGVRAIRRNDKWGFEKENGQLLVDCQYKSVQCFREYYDYEAFFGEKKTPRTRMLAIVEEDWCSGCIDMFGEIVFHIREHVRLDRTKPEYPHFQKSDNKLWAMYYDPRHDDIIPNGNAKVQVDGSLILGFGVKIPAKYDWGRESGDYTAVIKDGFWGMIDEDGKEIIPCIYDEFILDYILDKANNRLFILRKNGKYGMVNNKGEEVVPFIYDDYDSLPQE